MNSQMEIDFKEPNILIKNELKYDNNSNFEGTTLFNFLNQNIEIAYQLKNNIILLKSPENNNDIKINSTIELSPFYLNSNINLNKLNLNFLVDELIFAILNLKPDLLGNINGDIKLILNNVEHELIRSGNIGFNISQKTIYLREVLFNIGEIGQIKTDIKYKEESGDIIFHSSNSLQIKNKKEFAKKFQVKLDKVKDINVMYFKIEKNISTRKISIFDIKINQTAYIDKKSDKTRLTINYIFN